MLTIRKAVESKQIDVNLIGVFPEEITFRRVHHYLDSDIEFRATTGKFKSFSYDLEDKKDIRVYTTPPLQYCAVSKLIVSDLLINSTVGQYSFSVTFEDSSGRSCVTSHILTSHKRDLSVYKPKLIFELKDISDEF